ncbi:uncharacterized protein LOC107641752 [Arachis ipaensis]|uniref:uncharacterized protein LOC107641752 n=1 Tax=Arachis ipaensis TaxID=130454 RepID=UPI0007AF58DB|nr:uncharacterized protein LOC107641752 [Arachis ipaensis]
MLHLPFVPNRGSSQPLFVLRSFLPRSVSILHRLHPVRRHLVAHVPDSRIFPVPDSIWEPEALGFLRPARFDSFFLLLQEFKMFWRLAGLSTASPSDQSFAMMEVLIKKQLLITMYLATRM